jgi:hypothetical protein
MDLLELVIGRRPSRAGVAARVIKTAPVGAEWVSVRPRTGGPPVRARMADRSGVLNTARGPQHYRARRHYIVEYGQGDRSVVRRDLFDRIYVAIGEGLYEKRPDLAYRYFVLQDDATIMTPEGPEAAHAGDWIMEGLDGELYPMRPERGRDLYEAA